MVIVAPYASRSFQFAVIDYYHFEGLRWLGHYIESQKPSNLHGHKTYYTTSAPTQCACAEVHEYPTYTIKQTSNHANDQQAR